MIKLIRITTVPISLEKLIGGQMRFMKTQGFEVHMISSPYENAAKLEKKEGCPLITVNMTRTISPFKDLIALFKLVFILKKLKPSIVHTHTPKAGLLGMIASWIIKVPIRLHTVAGLPLMEARGFKRIILMWAERLTYRPATKVYPNSKNLKEFIIQEKFCKPEKLKVIGNGSSNGIDTEYFKANGLINIQADKLRDQFNITTANFVFIFIGRLVKDKGIEELVDAFVMLNESHNDIRLLLVGPFEPELHPLSNDCLTSIHTNSNIITSGFQNDIRPYLAMSNVLAFPSYREGFPNVPMQAGCFGLPCIVTDINGCNEIIEHEKNGLIIPAKNVQALKNAMERVFNDKILTLRLQSNARKMIVEKYDQNHFWLLLLSEYRMLLEQHGFVSQTV